MALKTYRRPRVSFRDESLNSLHHLARYTAPGGDNTGKGADSVAIAPRSQLLINVRMEVGILPATVAAPIIQWKQVRHASHVVSAPDTTPHSPVFSDAARPPAFTLDGAEPRDVMRQVEYALHEAHLKLF